MSTPSRPPASEAPRQLTFPLPPEIDPEDYRNIESASSTSHLALGYKNSVWIYSLPAFDLVDTINPGMLSTEPMMPLRIHENFLIVICESDDFEDRCFLYIWDLSARKCIGTVICNCEGYQVCTSVSLPSAGFSKDGKLEGTSPEWPQDPVLIVASPADHWSYSTLETFVLHCPDAGSIEGAIENPQGPLPMISATEIHFDHWVGCLSSMGRTALTGGLDMSVRTWDIITGKCQMVFIGHTSSVAKVHLDEERIYSFSSEGTIIVWDRYRGDCLHVQGAPLPELSWTMFVTPPYVVTVALMPTEYFKVFMWDVSLGMFEHITDSDYFSWDLDQIRGKERALATIEADEDPSVHWFRTWDLRSGQSLRTSSFEHGVLTRSWLFQCRFFIGIAEEDGDYVLKVWDFGPNDSVDAEVGNYGRTSWKDGVMDNTEHAEMDDYGKTVAQSPSSSVIEDTLPGSSTISVKRKRSATHDLFPRCKREKNDEHDEQVSTSLT